jgi:hypothetical protein
MSVSQVTKNMSKLKLRFKVIDWSETSTECILNNQIPEIWIYKYEHLYNLQLWSQTAIIFLLIEKAKLQ